MDFDTWCQIKSRPVTDKPGLLGMWIGFRCSFYDLRSTPLLKQTKGTDQMDLTPLVSEQIPAGDGQAWSLRNGNTSEKKSKVPSWNDSMLLHGPIVKKRQESKGEVNAASRARHERETDEEKRMRLERRNAAARARRERETEEEKRMRLERRNAAARARRERETVEEKRMRLERRNAAARAHHERETATECCCTSPS